MTAMGHKRRAVRRVPDVYALILADRRHMFTVGRPGYDTNPIGMPTVCGKWTFFRRVPDLHCLIFAGRGDTLAIRRPGHRSDPAIVTTIRSDLALPGNIPQQYLAPRSGCQVLAIRRPGHRARPGRRIMVGKGSLSCRSFPYLHRIVRATATGRGDKATVRRPCQGIDHTGMSIVD